MFLLNLVTPEKKLVTDQEVESVIVPAYRGQLNILPGHAPLMSTLSTGILRYKLKGESDFHSVVVSWGYCEVHGDGVVILAETAESLDDVDKIRAEEALRKAQKRLVEPDIEPDQIRKFQRKMQRAQARIDLATQKNH